MDPSESFFFVTDLLLFLFQVREQLQLIFTSKSNWGRIFKACLKTWIIHFECLFRKTNWKSSLKPSFLKIDQNFKKKFHLLLYLLTFSIQLQADHGWDATWVVCTVLIIKSCGGLLFLYNKTCYLCWLELLGQFRVHINYFYLWTFWVATSLDF